LPVKAKYPIAQIKNRKAIKFGSIPPIIVAFSRLRKVITIKTLAQLSAKFIYYEALRRKRTK
tara:strand:- start:813 stop:998 length:186 start_codon:yes stop_codon:yes gene_type:complete